MISLYHSYIFFLYPRTTMSTEVFLLLYKPGGLAGMGLGPFPDPEDLMK